MSYLVGYSLALFLARLRAIFLENSSLSLHILRPIVTTSLPSFKIFYAYIHPNFLGQCLLKSNL